MWFYEKLFMCGLSEINYYQLVSIDSEDVTDCITIDLFAENNIRNYIPKLQLPRTFQLWIGAQWSG